MDTNVQESRSYSAPIQNVLQRNSARIIAQDEAGIFLQDLSSGTFMIECSQLEAARSWLQAHPFKKGAVLMIVGASLAQFIKGFLAHRDQSLQSWGSCRQARWAKEELPELEGILNFVPAIPEDFPAIRDSYALCSDAEILSAIEENRIWMGIYQGQIAGFGGEHSEGSIGFLEILPEYRRHSLALEFEKFLIRHMRSKNLEAYAHIFTDNYPSLQLQEKLGMKIDPGIIVWGRVR